MYGCGEQEVGVTSGSGWNLWVWLLGVVVRRYIDYLILLIPTPLVSVLFCSSIYIYITQYVLVLGNPCYCMSTCTACNCEQIEPLVCSMATIFIMILIFLGLYIVP